MKNIFELLKENAFQDQCRYDDVRRYYSAKRKHRQRDARHLATRENYDKFGKEKNRTRRARTVLDPQIALRFGSAANQGHSRGDWHNSQSGYDFSEKARSIEARNPRKGESGRKDS